MAVYAGLFFAALIAATILPIQPEAALVRVATRRLLAFRIGAAQRWYRYGKWTLLLSNRAELG
ncbi:hypothetical protein [Mesorhizobium australicum]|uniref:hypothetical protein n=1 Tax=Mesorhizobium australicum TaxID=536018 RepID=UPI0003FADDA2